jgi:hypothetical protein
MEQSISKRIIISILKQYRNLLPFSVAQYVVQIYLPHFKRNANDYVISYNKHFKPFLEFKDNTFYRIEFHSFHNTDNDDFCLTLKEIEVRNLPYDTTYYEDTLYNIIDHIFGVNFSWYDEVSYVGSEDKETSTLKIML